MYHEPAVFVVDGDRAILEMIHELVRAMNTACRTFATGQDFLAAYDSREAGCVVLELQLPDASGPQIHQHLLQRGATVPVIFLTAHTDVSLAVALMRAGAFHYLLKPLRPVELMDAIEKAITTDRKRRRVLQSRQDLQASVASLSPAERQMLDMIAQGDTPSAMADELQLSLRTVELRRSKLMRKLRVDSFTGLLQFALLACDNGRWLRKRVAGRRSFPGRFGRFTPLLSDVPCVEAHEMAAAQRHNGRTRPETSRVAGVADSAASDAVSSEMPRTPTSQIGRV